MQRCNECIRGESAVALAARPTNRVIERRIHPSRLPRRASSRRAVCFKDLRVGFFSSSCSLSFFSSSTSRFSVSLHARPSVRSLLLLRRRLLFPRPAASGSGDAAALAAGDRADRKVPKGMLTAAKKLKNITKS